jgi:hypothetical protein
MPNTFIKKQQDEYDYVDPGGKGWRLKKGESLADLKKRAAGKGSNPEPTTTDESKKKDKGSK